MKNRLFRIALESEHKHSIRESVKRVQEVYEKMHPDVRQYMNPPATTKQIKDLEKELGVSISSEYKELLSLHNGQAPSTPGVFMSRFLSTEEVIRKIKSQKSLQEDFEDRDRDAKPGEGVKKAWWNEKWVPAFSSGGSKTACVDMDPASGGKKGQVIMFYGDMGDRPKVAETLAAYLDDVVQRMAEDLEAVIKHREQQMSASQQQKEISWIDRFLGRG